MGCTTTSRFLVRKSQKTLGQKNPSRAAAIWSVGNLRLAGYTAMDVLWEAVEGGILTGSGGEDDQACPVVFDEFAHDEGYN